MNGPAPSSGAAEAGTGPAGPDRPSPRRAWTLGIAVALAFLAAAFPLLDDHGATWDTVSSEFPVGERLLAYVLTGDPAFRDAEATEPRPVLRAPHPDFDSRRDVWQHAYPFAAFLSAVSCRVLWTELGWLPALEAHNLVVLLFLAGLLVVLVRFAAPRVGALAAVSAALFLAASPRVFAAAFTNLKDVPETALYVPATLLGYVALTRGGLRWWAGTGAVTGLALACKANALFVPPQLLLFLFAVRLVPAWRRSVRLSWSWAGFGLASLALVAAYLAVSPRDWAEPLHGPIERYAEVLRLGNTAFDAGATGTATSMVAYAPLFVSVTTPPVILVLGLLGLLSRRTGGALRAFLVTGLVVTIGRNMVPGARNYDGVRHFLEFAPYLCLAAGVGLATLVAWLPGAARGLRVPVVLAALAAPAWQAARTHPNGVAYFNALVGGLAGAQERHLPGATDYWGNSYWQVFGWLNEHAEPDARVLVTIAPHVGRAIAPVRLRDDLAIWRTPTEDAAPGVTYVTFVTRRPAYHALERRLEETRTPDHEVSLQGGVLARVYRLGPEAGDQELLALWDTTLALRAKKRRILDWMAAHPDEGRAAWEAVRAAPEAGRDATLARLREVLPAELTVGLEDVLDSLLDR